MQRSCANVSSKIFELKAWKVIFTFLKGEHSHKGKHEKYGHEEGEGAEGVVAPQVDQGVLSKILELNTENNARYNNS